MKKIGEILSYLDPETYFNKLFERIGIKKDSKFKLLAEIISAFITAIIIYMLAGFLLQTSMPATVVESNSMVPVFYRGDILIIRGVPASEIKAREVVVNYELDSKPLSKFAKTICIDKKTHIKKDCKFFIEKWLKGELTGKDFEVSEICLKDVNCYKIEKSGDIIIYFSNIGKIPIIHRAVLKIKAKDGYFFLTKGDNEKTNPVIDEEEINGYAMLNYGAVKESQIVGKMVFIIPKLGFVKLILLEDLPCLVFNGFDAKKCKIP